MNNNKEEKAKKHVEWYIFIWVVGIMIIAYGWLFTQVNSLYASVEGIKSNNTKIEVQLSQIQTDILWIKNKLSN